VLKFLVILYTFFKFNQTARRNFFVFKSHNHKSNKSSNITILNCNQCDNQFNNNDANVTSKPRRFLCFFFVYIYIKSVREVSPDLVTACLSDYIYIYIS